MLRGVENSQKNLKGVRKHLVNGYENYTSMLRHGPLALDGAVVQKISKRHFFKDIKNSFHGVTRIGLKPHQNIFKFFFQQIWSPEDFKVFAY